ncbi:helix-turn-helix transcriptional regulator [Jatrophihabitans endophyticus]|uniref:helix-turn-helix transcriptional regulator n=1 Tax=Jatrophihabitans endophyticus TaxID=1206085 RepID=UPI001A069A17|nr:helix-turn-helix transcriptional regulator [Jatrophihabitans endophyticus]MBE7187668.1 helix-turn-helix domain-containing protein [Jatrophihabitans endophyticus]
MASPGGLGDYLRARRELLQPDAFGLRDLGRRRVRGLRREEVAQLAGVSAHYYTRLEQGRARNPSPAVVGALARVFDLDVDARAHLDRLAEHAASTRPPEGGPEVVRPGIADLVHRWSDRPVVLLGRYRDVLAANAVAAAVNPAFVEGRNLLRHTFLDPEAREIYVDWDDVAAGAIAGVRVFTADDRADPHLRRLAAELSAASPEFAALWARHDVQQRSAGFKRYRSPAAGLLTLNYEALAVVGSPGQTMIVFSAEPGSPDEAALERLVAAPTVAACTSRTWSGTPSTPAGSDGSGRPRSAPSS